MNMKNVSIILKRVDQTKINATSKKNLEVMQKLKSEKEHLLKKVQQLTDKKRFYKKILEQHVGQNNTSYFDEEIILHPISDGKTENTYNEKETTPVKCKYEMIENNSKKLKTLTSNTEDSSEGKSSDQTKPSDAESKMETPDKNECGKNVSETEVSSKRKRGLPICILCKK